MKDPSQESIASNIGHGQYGLRSGLRTFNNLLLEDTSHKQVFVQLCGAKILNTAGWSVHTGSVYKITINETYLGRRLDVIAVRVGSSPVTVLSRADGLLVNITAGQYYYEPGSTTLYVRLSDSSDPADTAVLAGFGFYFSNVRVVQPTLGPNLITDGGFNEWSSPTVSVYYSLENFGAASGVLARESAIVAEGQFAAKLTIEGAIPNSYLQLVGPGIGTSIPGASYRVSAFYREASDNIAITPGISVLGSTPLYVSADGRTSTTAIQKHILSEARGEYKRFLFDVIAPDDSGLEVRFYVLAGSSTGRGSIWFDGFAVQRIWTFEEYQNRLQLTSTPKIDEGRGGTAFEPWYTGKGSLVILNDGDLEDLFGSYRFTSVPVLCQHGGRYENGGNEIPLEDMWKRRWTAPNGAIVSEEKAIIDLEDARNVLNVELPMHSHEIGDTPDMEAKSVERMRVIAYGGPISNVSPVRVDKNGYNMAIWEVVDPTYDVSDTGSAFTFINRYSYVDEEAAEKLNSARRLSVDSQVAYYSGVPSRAHAEQDIKIFEIISGINDKLDFSEGGVVNVATLTPGLYTANTLRLHVAAQMTAVAGTYIGSYDDSTHKFEFEQTAPATTFSIHLTDAAVNKSRSAWPTLGFTASIDKTLGLFYESDTPVFVDCDTEHIFRCDITGYRDDVSGTYTGSTGSNIEEPGDVIYHILRKILGISTEFLNMAAVEDVRTGVSSLAMYLGIPGEKPQKLREIFHRIENSFGVELLYDGDKFSLRQRDNTTPSDIVTITNSYLLQGVVGWWDPIYSVIKIEADQNATTGLCRSGTIDAEHFDPLLAIPCAAARAMLGFDRMKIFRTYLPDSSSWWNSLILNSVTPRRMFEVVAQGIVLRKVPGDKVILAADRFLGRTTAAPTVLCRIISAVHDPTTWVSTLRLAEVLPITGGW